MDEVILMKLSTKEMILTSLFTALTAIGAFISIPIGDVPITLQSMFSLLAGLLLGSKLGALSQVIYIILGLSGIRIFANFSGGPQYIFKPSFGFMIGFVFASFIVGKMTENNPNLNFKKIFLINLIGTIVIYICGVPYMYVVLNHLLNIKMGFMEALKAGFLIFIPGDLLKAILSSFLASKLIKRI